jgi:hypothetical protein
MYEASDQIAPAVQASAAAAGVAIFVTICPVVFAVGAAPLAATPRSM